MNPTNILGEVCLHCNTRIISPSSTFCSQSCFNTCFETCFKATDKYQIYRPSLLSSSSSTTVRTIDMEMQEDSDTLSQISRLLAQVKGLYPQVREDIVGLEERVMDVREMLLLGRHVEASSHAPAKQSLSTGKDTTSICASDTLPHSLDAEAFLDTIKGVTREHVYWKEGEKNAANTKPSPWWGRLKTRLCLQWVRGRKQKVVLM